MDKRIIFALMLVATMLLVTSCTTDEAQEGSTKGSGAPAKVDQVDIELIQDHYYAVVKGFYPDPCTGISDITQDVEEERIVISLFTDRPQDLMCAQMLTEYQVNLLLETGGLPPGEFTVEVNDRQVSFSLGQ